jgi:hypothetical protein
MNNTNPLDCIEFSVLNKVKFVVKETIGTPVLKADGFKRVLNGLTIRQKDRLNKKLDITVGDTVYVKSVFGWYEMKIVEEGVLRGETKDRTIVGFIKFDDVQKCWVCFGIARK